MKDFFTINRYALILRPARPMVDWLNAKFPEDPVDYDSGEEHDKFDVFLIPEFRSTNDALGWLQENFRSFLEYVLEEWCGNDVEWPEQVDWALFEKFIEYSFQTVVVDTLDEDYDEEFEDWELN